jgi:metabotropic glutamate receptor 1
MKQQQQQLLNLFLLINIMFTINCMQSKRKRVLELGDLMLGALIPVHEIPNDAEQTSSKRKCGTIRDQYGVQRVEALLYLLDKINNKTLINILPGIKLGLEIRDECWDASIALEETIDFIKDSISSPIENDFETDLSKTVFKNRSYPVVEPNINNNNCMYQTKKSSNGQSKILAVIGPSGSTVAITVQNLLQLFDIPQVGFSASSADLSNKKMYKTFLRVVPSDYLQVQAMVDIVLRMNWTYLFAVYTDGVFEMKKFHLIFKLFIFISIF